MRSNANKNVIDLFSFSSNGNSVNARIVHIIRERLLSDTTKNEAIFTNPWMICNLAKMKEYNVLKLYSCDIVHCDKTKDDFEATIIETLFEEPSIILSDREPRIEYLEKTDITLFGNTANHVIENETESARYGFETMKITTLVQQKFFSCS